MTNSFVGSEVRLAGQPNLTVVGVDRPEADVFTVRVLAQFDPPPGLDRMADLIQSAWTLTLILPNGVEAGSTGADTGAGPEEMTYSADFDRSSLTAGERRVRISHPDLSRWETSLGIW